MTGKGMPDDLRAMCSHASSGKLIYAAMSVVSDTVEAFAKLMSTTRESKGLEGPQLLRRRSDNVASLPSSRRQLGVEPTRWAR